MLLVGFLFIAWQYFHNEDRATQQRNDVLAISSQLLQLQASANAQESLSEQRLTRALSSVQTIVRQERITQERRTREFITREVRTTVTATTTSTVTATPTQCRGAIVADVCQRGNRPVGIAMGLVGLALPVGAFLLTRRALE